MYKYVAVHQCLVLAKTELLSYLNLAQYCSSVMHNISRLSLIIELLVAIDIMHTAI